MTTYEELVLGRAEQERRGYRFFNGDGEGCNAPCCPGGALAGAVGLRTYVEVALRPSALALAREFWPSGPVSYAVHQAERALGRSFTLGEVLERWDAAVAEAFEAEFAEAFGDNVGGPAPAAACG